MRLALKILVSLIAISLVLMHHLVPYFRVDAITLALLGVAVLPWVIEYVAAFDVPGLGRITLKDVEAIRKKLDVGISVPPPPGTLRLTTHPPSVKVSVEDPFALIGEIADKNPNLALVAFRIEVELRLRELARRHDILHERVGLSRIIRALTSKGILEKQTGSGLSEIVDLGNRAAHGAEVSDDAADWVLEIGRNILAQLDEVLSNDGNAS